MRRVAMIYQIMFCSLIPIPVSFSGTHFVMYTLIIVMFPLFTVLCQCQRLQGNQHWIEYRTEQHFQI